MFQNLSKRLVAVVDRLKGRATLSEADVTEALRDVRIALLEADVALPVVKRFIEDVKEKAIGQVLIKSQSIQLNAGQMVVKIVHDHLIDLLGKEAVPLNLHAAPPVFIMMVGLQGSGKTTSSGKLAYYLSTKLNKKVMLVSVDIYRPAARQQLAVLSQDLQKKGYKVESLDIIEGEQPEAIVKRAKSEALKKGIDVVVVDSAGRLHIDDVLMQELQTLKNICNPTETILVADAMSGQDIIHVAKTFHEQITLSALFLTRIDGDARGGAALSIRHMTGCPIKFLGVGEKIDQIELFQPERLANKILDMGDVIGLVEKALESVDQEEAEKIAKKMQSGVFTLNDMVQQLQQMQKMGGMSSMLNFLPGIGKIKDQLDQAGMNDKMVKRQIAIVQSMTKKERRYPDVLNASRKKRVAKGAGTDVASVNRLLKQFSQMQLFLKKMKKMGKSGMTRGGFSQLKGLLGDK